jgi:hypothetical protein
MSGNKMIVDSRPPGGVPVLNITALSSGSGGRVKVTAANHDITAMALGEELPGVHVSGVTTCTSGPPDCGANGYWNARGIEVDQTSAMTGNTYTSSGHPFSNGDTAWLFNCIANPSMNNAKYTLSNVTSSTVDLTGFTGTPCGISAHLIDNMRLLLDNTSFSGTYGSQSGTITMVATGMQVTTSLYPHASGVGGCPDYAFCGNSQGGDFVATANRVRWDAVCDYDMTFSTGTGSVGPNGWNFGTYYKPNVSGLSGSQGQHFYHQYGGNTYANRPMHFEAMRRVQHSTAFNGAGLELMEDFSFVSPSWGEYTPTHYWNGLIEFYFQTIRNSADFAPGGICQFSNIRTAVVAGEVDTHVSQVQATYTGTKYEVAWEQPQDMPVGTTYDVAYSTTGSLHTAGFSAGTSGGSVTGLSNSVYADIYWTSGAMAEAANFWVAIRPHMVVQSQTGNSASTIIISPFSGHDLQDGDTVTVAGVANVPDGTYPIDRIAPIKWTVNGGGLGTSVSVTSGVATFTVSDTTGVYPGMGLSILSTGVYDIDTYDPQHNRSIVTEVTDSTHLKASNVAAADGTYTLGASGTMATFSAMSLRGTTPTGSAGSAGNGTVTPADSTRGFYEMQISSGAGPTSSAAASGGNFAAGGSYAK